MGGQTSYVRTLDVGVPGMLADLNLDSRVVSFPAGETIPFGRLCEVDSAGNLHLVHGGSAVASANSAIAGVSVFDVAREQVLATTGGSAGNGYYNSGDMVPVMRKGRIFGAWDNSGTQLVYGAVNVHTLSTTDTNGVRGVFSNGAVNTTAGSEITACPAEIITVRNVATLTPQRGAASANDYEYVCLLEVNLPGA